MTIMPFDKDVFDSESKSLMATVTDLISSGLEAVISGLNSFLRLAVPAVGMAI